MKPSAAYNHFRALAASRSEYRHGVLSECADAYAVALNHAAAVLERQGRAVRGIRG